MILEKIKQMQFPKLVLLLLQINQTLSKTIMLQHGKM